MRRKTWIDLVRMSGCSILAIFIYASVCVSSREADIAITDVVNGHKDAQPPVEVNLRDLSRSDQAIIEDFLGRAVAKVTDAVGSEVELVFSDPCQRELFKAMDMFSRKSRLRSPNLSTTTIVAVFPQSDHREPVRRVFGDRDRLIYHRINSSVSHPLALINIVDLENDIIESMRCIMEYVDGSWRERSK